jgi:hypothetical protein
MPLIRREALPPVELPTEEVPCAPLGGAVLVRGLDMPQMLRWSAERRRLLVPLAGETEDAARERAGANLVPLLLEMAVVLDDGMPAYTAAQWGALGARHPGDVMQLFSAALRLAGQDADTEKKT